MVKELEGIYEDEFMNLKQRIKYCKNKIKS